MSAQKLDQQHLSTLNHQLREQDQRKNEFLAMLAHEMRNPLAPIRNAAELCSRTIPPNSPAHAAIAIVKRQANQLSRLVDDLLDVSRISQGRIDLKTEIVELKTLIEMARETVAPLMSEKQHELSIIQAHETVYVKGDLGRLVQALSNVLTNAAKYTQARGQIRMRVESKFAGVGQGSTFEIVLPRSQPIAQKVKDSFGSSRLSRRIMLVDDNVDAATSLAEILRLEGHECEVVFSAYEAVERAAELNPDFVLLDIGLPGLDGYEVARRLRQIDVLEGASLIALTGYGQREDIQRARDAGFDAHFVKPLDFRQLELTLARGRSNRRRAQD